VANEEEARKEKVRNEESEKVREYEYFNI